MPVIIKEKDYKSVIATLRRKWKRKQKTSVTKITLKVITYRLLKTQLYIKN
jgi:hypothetical protein